jgi:hypothetical protein
MTKSKAKKMANAAGVKKMAKAGHKFKERSGQIKNGKKQRGKQKLSKEEAPNQDAQESTESFEDMKETEQRAGSKRKALQDDGDRQDQSKKAKFHSGDKSTETPNNHELASKPSKAHSGNKSTQTPNSHDIPPKAPQLPEGTNEVVNCFPQF